MSFINTLEIPRSATNALLVRAYWKPTPTDEARSLLSELAELVDTLGLTVVDEMLVKVVSPQSRYVVGTGKAAEISARAKALGAKVIVFDNTLSPGQQRNWEKLTGLAAIDREEVILDIFARRAQTREARLQVELARLEYSLPRLARAWTHLSRQQGIGGKGEGESQLETDRRLIRKKIDRVKADLVEVRNQRATQRKQRQRVPIPQAAIVGYTNAGKSSLLKALTGAQVLVEDKLFATLDPTTRQIELPNGQRLLLTDTVGFVRNLPHRIVEAFKATLEEALLADFLVHVLDITQPDLLEFHRTTMSVLQELGADEKQIITVFNKIDLLPADDPTPFQALKREFPKSIFISTRRKDGLEELTHRLRELLSGRVQHIELYIPTERGDLLAELYRCGNVISSHYIEGEETGFHHVYATLSPKYLPHFESYRIPSQVNGKTHSFAVRTHQKLAT